MKKRLLDPQGEQKMDFTKLLGVSALALTFGLAGCDDAKKVEDTATEAVEAAADTMGKAADEMGKMAQKLVDMNEFFKKIGSASWERR